MLGFRQELLGHASVRATYPLPSAVSGLVLSPVASVRLHGSVPSDGAQVVIHLLP